MLPRVCKRWARILEQPSCAWEHANIDIQLLHDRRELDNMPPQPFLDARVIAAWWTR